MPKHHPPIRDDEVGGPPVKERPQREPADDYQPQCRDCSEYDGLGGLIPCRLRDYRAGERRYRGRDHEYRHGPNQPLPVGVTMQHHLLVGCQHILRIAHDVTLALGVAGWAQMHHITGGHRDGLTAGFDAQSALRVDGGSHSDDLPFTGQQCAHA